MTASNTLECIEQFRGQKLRGILTGTTTKPGLEGGSMSLKILVFEDGRGLVFAGNGSYWVESADDVVRRVQRLTVDLERAGVDASRALAALGAA